MSVASEFPSSKNTPTDLPASPEDSFNDPQAEFVRTKPRNFILLAFYQIVMRTGWIFKTESIVMPAVLDLMGCSAWMRACLPMLNRFGQSVPPLLAASTVQATVFKKRFLAITSGVMGVVFILLSLLWTQVGDSVPIWLPYAFLALYCVFFMSTGLNQLVLGTLQGKLIATGVRGRFMLVANSVGATIAIIAIVLLLSIWLNDKTGNFVAIFAFTGITFVVGALVALFLDENPSRSGRAPKKNRLIKDSLETLRNDKQLRMIALTAALFGMSMTLFPHYQALGREKLGLPLSHLMIWIIAQNIGLAVFSVPIGWVADRFGNRLSLKILLGGIVMAPLLAIVLARFPEIGKHLFFLVFVLVGLTPVTFKTLNNYTLELTKTEFQPKYLSLLSLCLAGPAIFTSVLIGLLLDYLGFEVVFVLVAFVVFLGWLLTFRISEPRQLSHSS